MLRVDFHSLGPLAARDIKSWTSISSAFKDLPCIYHGSFCWELIRIVNRYYNRVLEQQNSSIFFFLNLAEICSTTNWVLKVLCIW